MYRANRFLVNKKQSTRKYIKKKMIKDIQIYSVANVT